VTKLVFAPVTTSKIRVVINNAQAGYSRIVELEAWSGGTSNLTSFADNTAKFESENPGSALGKLFSYTHTALSDNFRNRFSTIAMNLIDDSISIGLPETICKNVDYKQTADTNYM
jgi:hypothetical protein